MPHIQMVIIEEGTTVRIIAPYTDKYGILAILPETLEVDDDQWDPRALTLWTDEMMEFQPMEIRFKVVYTTADYDLWIPADAKVGYEVMAVLGSDTITTTVWPVYQEHTLNLGGGAYDGTILVDGILYPAMMQSGIDNTLPMAISEDMWYMMEMDQDGIVITYSEYGPVTDIDTLARYLVPMYNYGYQFSFFEFNMARALQYRLVQLDRDIIYVFLDQLYPNALITDTLIDTKSLANDIIYIGRDEAYMHRLMHTMPPYMAWFFMPSGWYHYGYQTDYQWLLTMDKVDIPMIPNLSRLLLGITNKVPYCPDKGVFSTHTYEAEFMGQASEDSDNKAMHLSYDLPDHIKDALAIINQDRLRVVLAGGFVVTKGDYDFFILDGDKDTARDMMRLLGVPGNNLSVNGSVITDMENSYQYILGTNMHSILDVLYSFDLSHTMIAHDGRQYHITPEFMTFTSAGLSLMVYPIVREDRLRKTMEKGHLSIVYLHDSYIPLADSGPYEPPTVTMASSIDDAMVEVTPQTMDPIRQSTYHGIHDEGILTGLAIGRNIDLRYLKCNIFGNGINQGAIPPDDGLLYYSSGDILIREVLPTTPLV